MEKYIECGMIRNTHGTDGAVKAESWCDSPEVLASLPEVYTLTLGVYRPLNVTKASVYKDTVIFSFEEIDDIDKAAKLKGKTIYALRSDFMLDEGEYFISDLIGLDVTDASTGKVYGKVSDIRTGGVQLLYEVKTESGIKLLPGVDAFVKEVVPGKAILVTPIPGLLDDGAEEADK